MQKEQYQENVKISCKCWISLCVLQGPMEHPGPDQLLALRSGHCLWRPQTLRFLAHLLLPHMGWSWRNYEGRRVCSHKLLPQEPSSLCWCLLIPDVEFQVNLSTWHRKSPSRMSSLPFPPLPNPRSCPPFTYPCNTDQVPRWSASIWAIWGSTWVNRTLIWLPVASTDWRRLVVNINDYLAE